MNILRPLSPHLKSAFRRLIIPFIILTPVLFCLYFCKDLFVGFESPEGPECLLTDWTSRSFSACGLGMFRSVCHDSFLCGFGPGGVYLAHAGSYSRATSCQSYSGATTSGGDPFPTWTLSIERRVTTGSKSTNPARTSSCSRW
uniref:hypothetical protein n=1 Tax=Jatropha curcas TaxID=180498 RepID=UPI00279CEC79|nr:hypothetical protein QLP06_mgp086 [Jatropha curcas]WFG81153.1 hypothetical protein [Jatropha curcas]